MDKQTMYKVVNHNLTSIVVGGRAKVTYSTKRYVQAPKFLREAGYGPTVFETIVQAFVAQSSNGWEGNIWEVRCDHIYKPKTFLEVRGIQMGHITDNRHPKTNYWPEGTWMAGKVRLVRKVQDV